MGTQNNLPHNYHTITAKVKGLISEIIGSNEWDADNRKNGSILLGKDIGLRSLDFARLAAKIQQHYSERFLPFQNLLINDKGGVHLDISIDMLTQFIAEHTSGGSEN
ncbi:MAG: hypothetical protein GF398_01820 [Chitinivibrionales bacterium]|nr:hypothetical protein [Chitinivibrionales bacterium]